MTGHVIFKQLYTMSVELTMIWYGLLRKKNEHIAHIAYILVQSTDVNFKNGVVNWKLSEAINPTNMRHELLKHD